MQENRKAFVERALAGRERKSDLCRAYNISRPTGDKWIQRYLQGESMEDRPRTPNRVANRTAADTEARILSLRRERPVLGAKKIKRILENEGHPMPGHSTVNAILKRNGCIMPEASQAATPYRRFERRYPNDLWQADYKGHVPMESGQRCHPLAILDDHSRFCLCLDAKADERNESAWDSFCRTFSDWGLPNTVLCDNGNPWGSNFQGGLTKFEVSLMDLGILPIHGRPHHPQTQGKEERFNQTLNRECLRLTALFDLAHAQAQFDPFRSFYNEVRPHHALGLAVPASRYKPSKRPMPEKIEAWEYPQGYTVRKVDKGYLRYHRKDYFLSKALIGLPIGLHESEHEGCLDIHYRQFCIARLDLASHQFVSRRILRAKTPPP